MRQVTLATVGFERYSKPTRRAAFLDEMNRVVAWRELCALMEPVYPNAGKGRAAVGLERMLRIYFLQQWFNLSDPGAEEALYASLTMRRFVGIDLGCEPVPDGFAKVRYRELDKNANRLFVTCALSNLFIVRHRLLRPQGA